MTSRLKKVNPPSESPNYEILKEQAIKTVRNYIDEWPKNVWTLFNKFEKEDSENNELLKIVNVLARLEDSLSEDDVSYVIPCKKYICIRFPNLQAKPDRSEKFKIGGLEYTPECADVSRFDNNRVNTSGIGSRRPECADVSCSSGNILTNNKYLLLLVIMGGVLAVCFSNILFTPKNISFTPKNRIEEWTQNIRSLQEKFPSQNEKIWYSIMAGVKTIVTEKPTKPSVFLLLHNDKKTSACLASEVGKEAVKFLSNSLQEPIIIQGEHLKLNKSLTKDYAIFTESYKHDIEKKHVMIVLDLQEVPAMLAQTFHVLCDVENPLVRNAAFLFTMEVNVKEKRPPTAIAEEYLNQLWKDKLDIDIMDPLITRITNEVVSVKMESHLPCDSISEQLMG